MIDAIVYNPDSSWLESISNKTPVFSNDGHSVVLVRVSDLNDVQGEILSSANQGEDVFILLNGASLTKYNLAYPRPLVLVPASNTLGMEREAYTYQRPMYFGGFA